MRFQRPLPPEDLESVHLGAIGLWPELEGARIFITGATGFFGKWLIESLLFADKRHKLAVNITALSRDPTAFLNNAPHLAGAGLNWIKGSVAGIEPDFLDGAKFDFVLHLATESDMRASSEDPGAMFSVITDGTRRILDVAISSGAKRFLLTSSGAVYGRQPPDVEFLPETHSVSPDLIDKDNPYALPGEAKRQAESLCVERALRDGLGAVIARGFTFAGPGLPTDSKFAFGNFVRDAVAGRPIVLQGDGTAVRSYMHAADLTIWLWTLLLKGEVGRSYNVGSENPTTMLQLAKAFSQESSNPNIEVRGRVLPGASPDRYVPSTLRARSELGLRESMGLTEIVRRSVAWQRCAVQH